MIHAPREGSDSSKSDRRKSPRYFYPRSPQGERQGRACAKIKAYKFLSTFPARGATSSITEMVPSSLSFLPTLPARGATENGHKSGRPRKFLSTLPARGAPPPPPYHHPESAAFLSTLPARGATFALRFLLLLGHISIHAPREGSDIPRGQQRQALEDFYPRSPRGERLNLRSQAVREEGFLSTLPARGATIVSGAPPDEEDISIHAPREGSDFSYWA